jgi:hypothetical protein
MGLRRHFVCRRSSETRTPAPHQASRRRPKARHLYGVTPSGEKCLHDTLARRGQDFGPTSLIRTVDPRKIRKEERRKLAAQAAGHTSRRVYTGIRHLDAALAARHLERIRRALARNGSSLASQATA